MYVILSGSSGVGKNTIIKNLTSKNRYIAYPISATTRQMRDGESQNNPYIFLSKEEFMQKVEDGSVIEYEEIHGNYYGSILDGILLANGDNITIIKDVGVEGTFALKELLKKHIKVITIFLDQTKEELKSRLYGRGEKDIELRLDRYEYERSFIDKYDYVIFNEDIQSTIEEIEKIIEKERDN